MDLLIECCVKRLANEIYLKKKHFQIIYILPKKLQIQILNEVNEVERNESIFTIAFVDTMGETTFVEEKKKKKKQLSMPFRKTKSTLMFKF